MHPNAHKELTDGLKDRIRMGLEWTPNRNTNDIARKERPVGDPSGLLPARSVQYCPQGASC